MEKLGREGKKSYCFTLYENIYSQDHKNIYFAFCYLYMQNSSPLSFFTVAMVAENDDVVTAKHSKTES